MGSGDGALEVQVADLPGGAGSSPGTRGAGPVRRLRPAQLLYGPLGSQFDTGGFDHPDRGDACRLWNLAPRIPEEHRFSRIYEGQGELIDHLLISHALLDGLVSVDVDVSGLPSIGPNPTVRRSSPGSDHAPLIAHFT